MDQDRGGQSLNHAILLQEQVETSGDGTTRFNKETVHRIQENQLEINSPPTPISLVSILSRSLSALPSKMALSLA